MKTGLVRRGSASLVGDTGAIHLTTHKELDLGNAKSFSFASIRRVGVAVLPISRENIQTPGTLSALLIDNASFHRPPGGVDYDGRGVHFYLSAYQASYPSNLLKIVASTRVGIYASKSRRAHSISPDKSCGGKGNM